MYQIMTQFLYAFLTEAKLEKNDFSKNYQILFLIFDE